MTTPKTMSQRQRRAVQAFAEDCPGLGIQLEWACLPTPEIWALRVRQIRKARGLLAWAYEPALGNYVVLTSDLRRLNVTGEEADAIDNQHI